MGPLKSGRLAPVALLHHPLTIFAKKSIENVRLGTNYA